MALLELAIGDGAKSIATAIKVVCNACQNLTFVWQSPSTLKITQLADNKIAWIEMLIVALKPVVPPIQQFGAWTVDAKSLAAAMRDVVNLKDTIGFAFEADRLVVATPKSSHDIFYQSCEPFALDTSSCGGDNVVAGKLTGLETKTLELMISDALASGTTVPIRMVVGSTDDDRSDDKMLIGESEVAGVHVSKKGSMYSAEFDGATLRQFVKNSIAGEIAIQVYDGLPMKLHYCLNKKKRATKKHASSTTTTASAIDATLQIFISPRPR